MLETWPLPADVGDLLIKEVAAARLEGIGLGDAYIEILRPQLNSLRLLKVYLAESQPAYRRRVRMVLDPEDVIFAGASYSGSTDQVYSVKLDDDSDIVNSPHVQHFSSMCAVCGLGEVQTIRRLGTTGQQFPTTFAVQWPVCAVCELAAKAGDERVLFTRIVGNYSEAERVDIVKLLIKGR